MVKDRELLERFNRERRAKKIYSYKSSLKIFEALWKEAWDLGILPLKDSLQGIESDLRIARAINHKTKDNV
jgi:hypothetical protein